MTIEEWAKEVAADNSAQALSKAYANYGVLNVARVVMRDDSAINRIKAYGYAKVEG